MTTKRTAISCKPSSRALSLSDCAAAADPQRFAGAHAAAQRVKVHDGSVPFMGAVGRVHAGREAKVLFFRRKIAEGRINPEALPGLLRDYPELGRPMNSEGAKGAKEDNTEGAR